MTSVVENASMPIGYLTTVALIAVCTAFAVASPEPRRSSPSNISYWFGFVLNELPFLAIYLLTAATLLAFVQHDLDSLVGRISLGLAVITEAGLVLVVARGLRARPATNQALTDALGADWRHTIDSRPTVRLRRRLPYARILFVPFTIRHRNVERAANLSYGQAGTSNLLDVYRHRSHPIGGPTLVYLHGGAFRGGTKRREGRPLIHRLAGQGWVCISANYRLSPAARFPDQLVDVKKVITWARDHSAEYGGDPTTLFVAGSSAGGHLASLAALTPDDPRFQPGFEGADTSVTAAIALYGYYGSIEVDSPLPSSPLAYVGPQAPPFFVAHGDRDTIVVVDDARDFVRQLKDASSAPVAYAELPGAQHTFDLFHSLRSEAVVDAIEAFAAWVRST